MKITVTQKDIAQARRVLKIHTNLKSCCCPVAKATRRRKGMQNALVGHNYISIDGRSWEMPRKAVSWIQRFDAGKPVKPIRFEITPFED